MTITWTEAKPRPATQYGSVNVVSQVVKAVSGQTADLEQWQDSSGNTVARVSSTGGIFTTQNLGVGTLSQLGAKLSVAIDSASSIGAIIRGISGQTGNLQEWQNSSGTALTSLDATGSILTVGPGTTSSNVFLNGAAGTARSLGFLTASKLRWALFANAGAESGSNAGSDLKVFNYADDGTTVLGIPLVITRSTGTVTTQSSSPSALALIVKGAASQSADLQQWQNSSGGIVAAINNAGVGTFNGVTIANVNAGTGVGLLVQTGAAGNAQALVVSAASQSVASSIVRAGSGQTGDLQQWQNSSATALTKIDATGLITVPNATGLKFASGAQISSGVGGGTAIVTGANNTSTVLICKAQSGQSADLQAWQDSTTASLARIDSSGNIQSVTGAVIAGVAGTNGWAQLNAGGAANTGYIGFYQPNQTRAGYIGFGTGSVSTIDTGNIIANSGQFTVAGQLASAVPFIVKLPPAATTTNLQQWQNSSGTTLANISDTGGMLVTTNGSGVQRETLQIAEVSTSNRKYIRLISNTLQIVNSGFSASILSLTDAGVLTVGSSIGNAAFSSATTATTVGAAGAASALPATPAGYWQTSINGTTVKIPYYAP